MLWAVKPHQVQVNCSCNLKNRTRKANESDMELCNWLPDPRCNFQFSDWHPVQKGTVFSHNLDEIPIEIKVNEYAVTTSKQKYVWFEGNVGQSFEQAGKGSVNKISIAITVPNYSIWLANCNGPNQEWFEPQPEGNEVILTIFKTATEVVVECDGVPCVKYTYSESTNDNRCNVHTLPTQSLWFVNFDEQVATQYRLTGVL